LIKSPVCADPQQVGGFCVRSEWPDDNRAHAKNEVTLYHVLPSRQAHGRWLRCGTQQIWPPMSKVGWTAGAGLEVAIGAGFSAKVEYLYIQTDQLPVHHVRYRGR
jgi:opacity protein-like surface antigen